MHANSTRLHGVPFSLLALCRCTSFFPPLSFKKKTNKKHKGEVLLCPPLCVFFFHSKKRDHRQEAETEHACFCLSFCCPLSLILFLAGNMGRSQLEATSKREKRCPFVSLSLFLLSCLLFQKRE